MIVYGANCVWWDTKANVATKPTGLPCCPHCGSVLFETDEDAWWAGVNKVNRGTPRYREFIEWMRGRCLPDYHEAWEVFIREVPV